MMNLKLLFAQLQILKRKFQALSQTEEMDHIFAPMKLKKKENMKSQSISLMTNNNGFQLEDVHTFLISDQVVKPLTTP